MSTTLHRHTLGRNAKCSSLYPLCSSFRFSQLALAGYYIHDHALLWMSVSQRMPVLVTYQSGTSAMLSSEVDGHVAH